MKINLIEMIFNTAGRERFDKLVVDDDGNELDALHSLDYLMLQYAQVRIGKTSDIVVVPKEFQKINE